MMNLNPYKYQVIIQWFDFVLYVYIFIFEDEIKIPGGGVPLTPDQASILTHFLYDSYKDQEKLHHVLTSIANASTFKESSFNFLMTKIERKNFVLGQINLANAGCINRLRELLLKLDNDLTKCKILLALNNLALNDFAITQFSVWLKRIFSSKNYFLCRISLR